MTVINISALRSPDGKLRGSYTGTPSSYSDGDTFIFSGGSFGVNSNYAAFSRHIVQATTIGQTPPNVDNYIFNESLGFLPVAYNDAERGKVLRTTQDNSHYDSIIKHHLPESVPENTWVYWSFFQKTNMTLGGVPYPYYFQRKLGRINYIDTIVDGQQPEVKFHVNSYAGGQYVDETRTFNANGTGYSIYGVSNDLIASDNTWHMAEIIVFTGTQGNADGRVIIRATRNGVSLILKQINNTKVYTDGQRFNWLLHQEYYGNFGVTANEGTKPDFQELFTDSSSIIIGDKRIDLCDTTTTETCTYRENQKWDEWNGGISLKVNTAGLSSGTHNLKMRVITGYDANGWDIVSESQDIEVVV